MNIEPLHPEGWKAAKGYSNGMVVSGEASLVFTAGQIAWNSEQELVGAGEFVAQFRQALLNVVEVVREAGGKPEHLVRLTIYVTDKQQYLDELAGVGAAYREVVGRHFPAMALVQVAGLLEPGALVESEGTAAVPRS